MLTPSTVASDCGFTPSITKKATTPLSIALPFFIWLSTGTSTARNYFYCSTVGKRWAESSLPTQHDLTFLPARVKLQSLMTVPHMSPTPSCGNLTSAGRLPRDVAGVITSGVRESAPPPVVTFQQIIGFRTDLPHTC